ncbi:unnamed protein product, partial [Pylaiella littoralis]
MGLVQTSSVLATGARGRWVEPSGSLQHAEADEHHLHNQNQGPALRKGGRWHGQGRVQKLQWEEDKGRASRTLRDATDTESSLPLELHGVGFTPIHLPPTTECLLPSNATAHHSSAVVVNSSDLVGSDNVWNRLQQAVSARDQCQSPPCCQGVHVHTHVGLDLGEEMSHVKGAIVVRRP